MDPIRAVDTCAADLGASPAATADTHAIRQRFTEVDAKFRQNVQAGMSRSEAIANTPPMIPDEVAQAGTDKARRGQVHDMIGCAGDRAGLGDAMTGELQHMYRDAANAAGGNWGAWLRDW